MGVARMPAGRDDPAPAVAPGNSAGRDHRHGLGPALANASATPRSGAACGSRKVLGRHGFRIENVVDTLERSRVMRPRAEGGHSLKVVCQRELGVDLDKEQQTSDWMRRPLTGRQEAYAALDAEVLVRLYAVLVDLEEGVPFR